VPHQVPGDRAEPLGPGDQCVLAGEAADEASFGVVVELGHLEDLGQLLVESLVDELQLGDAVLVIQRAVAPSAMASRKL